MSAPKKIKISHTGHGGMGMGMGNDMVSPRQTTTHFVLVTGGVMSGLGKGITTSSIGVLLKDCGWRVTALKIDPYLNCDAGTMSPFEHGECYVLEDGGETDLDLGNYERFLDINLTNDHSITAGKIYKEVIDKERRGDYLGKTVQVVPHITNEIMERLIRVAKIPVDGEEGQPDFCMIELGGTIGDIESAPFVEAIRQLKLKPLVKLCHVHLSLVPVTGDEQKTKPTQHGVQTLRSLGLVPDIICCRCEQELAQSTKTKIALHCNIRASHVISLHNVTDLWHVPLVMNMQHVAARVASTMEMYLSHGKPKLKNWGTMVKGLDSYDEECVIAIVGKYTGLEDSYLSILKALKHAAYAAQRKLVVKWVVADDLVESNCIGTRTSADKSKYDAAWQILHAANGILVPGGFGVRGVEGKIKAVHYARTNKKPFLGICLGMQVAVIEYTRNVLKFEDANSAEFNKETSCPVVMFMPEGSTTEMGGTMRLGARKTIFQDKGSLACQLYGGQTEVMERHRHRYEVNPEYIAALEKAGLILTGRDETGKRMEVIELSREAHPFFVGCQYHPELKSRVPVEGGAAGAGKASPPFIGLMMAASDQLEAHLASLSNRR